MNKLVKNKVLSKLPLFVLLMLSAQALSFTVNAIFQMDENFIFDNPWISHLSVNKEHGHKVPRPIRNGAVATFTNETSHFYVARAASSIRLYPYGFPFSTQEVNDVSSNKEDSIFEGWWDAVEEYYEYIFGDCDLPRSRDDDDYDC